MEESKVQALHDTLSKLKKSAGLGVSSHYNFGNIKTTEVDGKVVRADGLPNNPLYFPFVREGTYDRNKSDASKYGDGRVIKRNFDDCDISDSDNAKKKKLSKEEKKAAKKAAKLEAKRQAKLEEKKRAKREEKKLAKLNKDMPDKTATSEDKIKSKKKKRKVSDEDPGDGSDEVEKKKSKKSKKKSSDGHESSKKKKFKKDI